MTSVLDWVHRQYKIKLFFYTGTAVPCMDISFVLSVSRIQHPTAIFFFIAVIIENIFN